MCNAGSKDHIYTPTPTPTYSPSDDVSSCCTSPRARLARPTARACYRRNARARPPSPRATATSSLLVSVCPASINVFVGGGGDARSESWVRLCHASTRASGHHSTRACTETVLRALVFFLPAAALGRSCSSRGTTPPKRGRRSAGASSPPTAAPRPRPSRPSRPRKCPSHPPSQPLPPPKHQVSPPPRAPPAKGSAFVFAASSLLLLRRHAGRSRRLECRGVAVV